MPTVVLVEPASSDEVEGVLEVLLDAGADEVELAGAAVAGLFSGVGARGAVLRRLASRRIEASVRERPARMVDWDSVWAATLRPVHVAGASGALWVVPDGAEVPGSPSISLEVGEAFGSGMHPTTRLCLQALADHPPRGSVLDVGTGTGVLALAALRLGAASAVGVDTDPRALEVAAANARRNDLDGRFTVHDGELDALGRFDRVLANILGAPLAAMAPTLARRVGSGGELVLSGFPEGQADEVAAACTHVGMRLVARASQDGWARLDLAAGW